MLPNESARRMLSIHPLMESQIGSMRILARSIWQTTYASLISQAQIDFMLADRYAAARIRAQLDDPDHVWRLAWWEGEMVGFAHACMEASACKLEKLYIHPNYQRRGIGGALLAAVKSFARDHAATRLWLQVNRGNTAAIATYQKHGFLIHEARVFDIGGGFVMDDYVMDTSL